MRIVYKGDPDKINDFLAQGISGPFEVFFRGDRDIGRSVEQAVAVHFHYVLPDGRRINLADQGEIGDLSQLELRKVLDFARANNIDKIVFHPPTINVFTTKKEEALRIMSDRLEAEYDPNILFCIENVCLWINQAYTNEPLLVEAQDFIILRRIVQVPLGFVFDVEHFYVSTVMKFFYAELKEDFVRLQNGDVTYDEIRCKFERVLREYVSLGNTKLIGDECSKVIKEAFVLLDPYIEYVHVCGSDYTCYFYNSKGGFPVVGEHLPLGYKGFVEHNAVEDQVEHREWISVLKHKEMDVVLEISAKEGYNFFEQVKKSAEFIESLLDN